jgi:hypothetical protein
MRKILFIIFHPYWKNEVSKALFKFTFNEDPNLGAMPHPQTVDDEVIQDIFESPLDRDKIMMIYFSKGGFFIFMGGRREPHVLV